MSKNILMAILAKKKQDYPIIRTYLKQDQNVHIILINGEKLFLRHFSTDKIY